MSWLVPSPRDIGVIVVAAGRGRRAGGSPKQFRAIGGVPMVLRALRPFTAHPGVAHLTVVLPPGIADTPPDWLAALRGPELSLVAGGEERSDSVAAGLAALPAACTVVVVHDAARPFPARGTIDAVVAEARAGRAALAAVPVSDTIKEAAPGTRLVARTVPREHLWRAQTPQAFPRALLQRACAAGGQATDDAALVEALGEPVVLVPDDSANLKVTTEADFLLAEALARR